MQITYCNLEKSLILAAAVAGLAVGSVHAASYPDMKNVAEPTTNYHESFAPFTAPVDGGVSIDANAPQIADWTRQSGAGETMVLTAEGVNPSNALFIAYGEGMKSGVQTKVESACDIPLVDGRQCSVTLPPTLPSRELYLIWPHNEHGFGEPVAINRAEAWWVGFDTVNPGETFYIYGRNLTLDGTNAYCYIVEMGEWLTSTDANPYKAAFTMPATAANRTYTIYAHNGHGQAYGWSEPLSIGVESAYSWSANTLNVTNYGANGSDAGDDRAAFVSAIGAASDGDTLYIPDGTYYLSSTFTVNKRLHILGQSTNAVLRPTSDSVNPLVGGNSSGAFFENLTLFHSFANQVFGSYNRERLRFKNVVFSHYQSTGAGSQLVSLEYASNFLFEDCAFLPYKQLKIASESSNLRFDGCRFLGVRDCNEMASIKAERLDFSGCRIGNYDGSDASEGTGWAKGRWLKMNKGDYVYIGNNTITEMAPREPTPFFSNGVITSFTGLGDATTVWSLGNCKPCTFYFDDIPDEFDGRGDNSIDYHGVLVTVPYGTGESTVTGWVKENNAIANYVTVWIKEASWSRAEQMNSSVTTSAEFTDKIDQNSGEQILCEGFQSLQAGQVLSANADNLFISPAEASETGVTGSRQVFITGGRGLGQAREVANINTGTGEVSINGTWKVVPDATSTYILANGALNYCVYNNDFSAREDGLEYTHKATTALQISASHGLVFADNTLNNMRHVVRQYGHSGQGEALSGVSAPAPSYFSILSGNEVTGTAVGFDNSVKHWKSAPLVQGDSFMLGNVFRSNTLSSITYKSAFGFTDEFAANNTIGINVVEGNHVSDLRYVVSHPSQPPLRANVMTLDAYASAQVLVDNKFYGHSNITGLSNTNVVLHGNTWADFGQTYAASYSRLSVAQPKSIDGTVEIRNTGTAVLNWMSPSLGSGSIAPEQSTNLINVAEDTHTIESGAQTKLVEVAQLIQIPSSGQIDFPVSGYDGVWVKVRLINQVSGAEQSLGPWYSPTNIVLQGLPGTWYLMILETSATESGYYSPGITNSFGQSSSAH